MAWDASLEQQLALASGMCFGMMRGRHAGLSIARTIWAPYACLLFCEGRRAWAYRTVRQSDYPTCMRDVGLKIAVVSNFDLRLRPLLEGLGLDQPFDALIISAEVSISLVIALQCPSACQKVPCCHQNCSRGPMMSTVEGCATLCTVLPR